MGMAALKLRIMPEDVDTDMKFIEDKLPGIIEKFQAKIHSSVIEEVAFGLKSIVLTLAWPEQNSQDDLEEQLKSIEGVNSIEVIDFRRAIG